MADKRAPWLALALAYYRLRPSEYTKLGQPYGRYGFQPDHLVEVIYGLKQIARHQSYIDQLED